ncbi:hypothetical protein FAIPA1_30250 [Frankia sp. AiPs1]
MSAPPFRPSGPEQVQIAPILMGDPVAVEVPPSEEPLEEQAAAATMTAVATPTARSNPCKVRIAEFNVLSRAWSCRPECAGHRKSLCGRISARARRMGWIDGGRVRVAPCQCRRQPRLRLGRRRPRNRW